MAMSGPSTNQATAVGVGAGGIPPSWNQIVAAAAPPSAATITAVNSAPAGERGEGFDDAGNNGGGAGGRRHVWNKPSSNGGGGGGSSSTEDVKPAIDDADSWPALLDSARAAAKSPSLSEPLVVKAAVPELQGTRIVLPSQRQVRDNAGMNNVMSPHQRPYKRGNSNLSLNGGYYSPHVSGPQGSQGFLTGSGSHNHPSRSGFVPSDHNPQPQRNSFRNRTGGSRPSGGAHHHNYGGRRDQGHGNQEWNNHRNFNGRENYMSPRFGPRFIRPPASPHPTPAHIYPPPPPSPIRPFGPMGFPELPHQMIYVPPPLESLGGYPFSPSMPSGLVYFHPPDPHLQTKIVNQIDYYFSNDNLIKDLYLREHMDEQGWVPISLIANFNKVKQLTEDVQIVLEALPTSSVVEVQGDKIRKRNDWGRWIIPHSSVSPP